MAFEERCSPNADNVPSRSPPDSPESSRTSPYTCSTIKSPVSGSFLRITSFALESPPKSPSPQQPPEPVIQTLKYSINNILKPEFGKNALLVKARKGGDGRVVGFRPYEGGSPGEPLGSLCQAVEEIGGNKEKERSSSPKIIRGSPPVKLLPNPEEAVKNKGDGVPTLWPAWVYCTRYSDRPSSGKSLSYSWFLYLLYFIIRTIMQ